MWSSISYSRIDTSNSEKDSEDGFDISEGFHRIARSRVRECIVSIAKYLATVSFLAFAMVLVVLVIQSQQEFEAKCWELHNIRSPATREIDTSYREVRFKGAFNEPSIYRGRPSVEIDAAWSELEQISVMNVSKEDLLLSGNDASSVKLPEEYGGGYIATLEFQHQLHCLNFIRKASWYNWEYYQDKSPEFGDHPDMVRTHLDHCYEMLRQVLMCNADVGLIGHHWVKGFPRPHPVFSTMHKCRNFDSVLEFARKHQVVEFKHELQPMPGQKIWDRPV